jgi:hypothetical protein
VAPQALADLEIHKDSLFPTCACLKQAFEFQAIV